MKRGAENVMPVGSASAERRKRMTKRMILVAGNTHIDQRRKTGKPGLARVLPKDSDNDACLHP